MGQLLLVLNGSFRSGTSMLWSVLKDSNPEVLCFYEPCHPKLSDLIKVHPPGTVNDLHQDVLFDEYHRAFEDPVSTFHDSLSQTEVYPNSMGEIRERVSKFIDTEEDYILQTNRWHFHLGGLHSEYGCSLLHVLRNPFRVWDSVQRGIRKQGKAGYQLRRFIMNRSLGDFFGSNSIYLTAKEIHPHSEPLLATSFQRFIAGWVVSNSYAVNAVQEAGGTVLTYEHILASGGDVLDTLLLHNKVHLRQHASIRRKETNFLDTKEQAEILGICRRFGIEDQFNAIMSLNNV